MLFFLQTHIINYNALNLLTKQYDTHLACENSHPSSLPARVALAGSEKGWLFSQARYLLHLNKYKTIHYFSRQLTLFTMGYLHYKNKVILTLQIIQQLALLHQIITHAYPYTNT